MPERIEWLVLKRAVISWCHFRPRQYAGAQSCRIDQQYQFPRPAQVSMPAFNPSLQGAATPRLDKFHLTLLVRLPREGLVIQPYHEEVRVRLERVPHTAGFTRSFVETRRRLGAPDRQAASGQYPGVRRESSLPDRSPPRGPTSAMGSQSHPICAELKAMCHTPAAATHPVPRDRWPAVPTVRLYNFTTCR